MSVGRTDQFVPNFSISLTCLAGCCADVHAFLGWFDIGFEACHKPVRFSTGPHSRYTHWKSTVFYIPGSLMLSQGEEIKGKLSVAPNERNHRDLDISISWEVEGHGEDAKGSMDYKM